MEGSAVITYCSVCREPQFETPGGTCCANGHGGAEPAEFVCPPPPSEPLTLIDRMRDHVAGQYDKNTRYEAMDEYDRRGFIDEQINSMPTIDVLEIISYLLEQS